MWWFKKKSNNDDSKGSMDNPIVISAENSMEGIIKEYAEITKRFGKQDSDWKLVRREQGRYGDQHLETFVIEIGNEQLSISFEISSWFGT